MTVPKSGIVDAAKRELEFHPMRKGSTRPIGAWTERANSLTRAIDEINALRKELDDLQGVLRSRPF